MLKLRNIYRDSLCIVILVFLVSCSVTTPTITPIVEETDIPAEEVWKNFLFMYPKTRLPYKAKLLTKVNYSGIVRRFTAFTIGDGKDFVKMDVASSGVYVIKIAENPVNTVYYLPTAKKAYLTKTDDTSQVELLLGFSTPMKLDSLMAILSGNASAVFSSYINTIPREGMYEFILKDSSRLFLAKDGSMIMWQDVYGWKIYPKVDTAGKQIGIFATLEDKGHSMEYIVETFDDIPTVELSMFKLELPPNVPVYAVKQ